MNSITTDIMVKDERHSFPLSVRVRRLNEDTYENAVIDFGYGIRYYLEDIFSPDPIFGLQFKEESDTLCLDISGRNFFGSPVYANVKDILEIPEVKQFLEYLDKRTSGLIEEALNPMIPDKIPDQFLLIQDADSTEKDVILNIGDISAFVYSGETEVLNIQMKSGTYLSLKITSQSYKIHLVQIIDFLIKRNIDAFYYDEHHLFLIVIKTLAIVKFKKDKLYLHLKNGKYLIADTTLKSYQIMLPELERKLRGSNEKF
jgi:hypothetical protein